MAGLWSQSLLGPWGIWFREGRFFCSVITAGFQEVKGSGNIVAFDLWGVDVIDDRDLVPLDEVGFNEVGINKSCCSGHQVMHVGKLAGDEGAKVKRGGLVLDLMVTFISIDAFAKAFKASELAASVEPWANDLEGNGVVVADAVDEDKVLSVVD